MIDARDQALPAAPSRSRRRTPSTRPSRKSKSTLRIERIFSDARVKPFDQLEWERRTAEITDDAGKVIFRQEDVEVPKNWSL